MAILKRSEKNPILKPDRYQSWEAEAVFNACPIQKDNTIYLLYRALSVSHFHTIANAQMRVSDIGIAESKNGIDFDKRRKFIAPEYNWERFGCEDPRVTKFEDKYYIFYTALSTYPFSADGIKVGVALSRDLQTVDEKHLVTPFNAKAMSLFPERVNGKMCAILTINTDRPPSKIALAYFDKEEDLWSEKYWKNWLSHVDNQTVSLQRRPQDHVELGAPPLKTDKGWLLLYCYIRDYFSSNRLFSIEAALLDLNDPTKIIARTQYALLTPEEEYEKYGIVPNTIFPSGALIDQDTLSVYYGAADTTCCVAKAKVSQLIDSMFASQTHTTVVKRAKENPLITPIKNHPWEAKATFNPAAFYADGKMHLVYRAQAQDNTSVFGYATSSDGIHIESRSPQPIYIPRESFEQKNNPNGNSGCEDPRITVIGDTLYMLYTAYDGVNHPRIAITSLPVKNFLTQKWEWTTPVLISPPEFDDKDACILPEKVNGKYLIFHRIENAVDIAFVENLDFDGKSFLGEQRWLLPRPGMWDSQKVGIAAPPIKIEKGWLLLYHGISDEDHYYRVGAVLLDLKDPTHIIGRTNEPLFEPNATYEKEGITSNVVFPCGAILLEQTLFIYYGGADTVVGVATANVNQLLSQIENKV